MHSEVLTKEQIDLLPLIKLFSRKYYLVGGTAIALQLGHRRSIDFDLFTKNTINRNQIKNIIQNANYSVNTILYEDSEQLHLVINGVKVTFFHFQYQINPKIIFEENIKMPSLIELAAMKAYAIGGRAKWKDYVDLYFLFKNYFSLIEISEKATEIFDNFFNEKLFREQLSYFKDVNYEEEIIYMKEEISDAVIKKYLTKVAMTSF